MRDGKLAVYRRGRHEKDASRGFHLVSSQRIVRTPGKGNRAGFVVSGIPLESFSKKGVDENEIACKICASCDAKRITSTTQVVERKRSLTVSAGDLCGRLVLDESPSNKNVQTYRFSSSAMNCEVWFERFERIDGLGHQNFK